MNQNTASFILLISGLLVAGHVVASEQSEFSASGQMHDVLPEFEKTSRVEFSGVAIPGSAVHEWISSSVRVPLDHSVTYSIKLSGELARAGFLGPEDFASRALMQSYKGISTNSASLKVKRSGSTTQNWNPGAVIPMPDDDGTPGSRNSGTQCGVLFGWPPQVANIEYTWEWKRTDTNQNGQIDADDEYGWHLTSYSVNFPEQNASIDEC